MAANSINIDLEKELLLLNEELDKNQEIFDQVKVHYDKIMQSKSSGTFKFITDQTSNIMNIRNNRLSIIKEMINVKKLNAEIKLKEMNINKDDPNSKDGILATARELYELMKNDPREGNINKLLSTNDKEGTTNQDTEEHRKNNEDILKSRMKEIASKKLNEELDKKVKETGYMFACDLDKNVYAIDREATTVYDDVDIPNFEITIYEDELTGLTLAKNQYGETMPVIEISH